MDKPKRLTFQEELLGFPIPNMQENERTGFVQLALAATDPAVRILHVDDTGEFAVKPPTDPSTVLFAPKCEWDTMLVASPAESVYATMILRHPDEIRRFTFAVFEPTKKNQRYVFCTCRHEHQLCRDLNYYCRLEDVGAYCYGDPLYTTIDKDGLNRCVQSATSMLNRIFWSYYMGKHL